HRPRIADRDDVIGPVLRQRLDLPYHRPRGEIWSGGKRAPDALAGGHDLHARTADVDRKDRLSRCTLAGFLRHRSARLTLSDKRECSRYACRGGETNSTG